LRARVRAGGASAAKNAFLAIHQEDFMDERDKIEDGDESGPLDGSTSGTIGGGGAETGGSTDRPEPPDTPKVKPEDAASGRRAPDTLGATTEPDDLESGPSDVSQR